MEKEIQVTDEREWSEVQTYDADVIKKETEIMALTEGWSTGKMSEAAEGGGEGTGGGGARLLKRWGWLRGTEASGVRPRCVKSPRA